MRVWEPGFQCFSTACNVTETIGVNSIGQILKMT
jgi:hypothetical protein